MTVAVIGSAITACLGPCAIGVLAGLLVGFLVGAVPVLLARHPGRLALGRRNHPLRPRSLSAYLPLTRSCPGGPP